MAMQARNEEGVGVRTVDYRSLVAKQPQIILTRVSVPWQSREKTNNIAKVKASGRNRRSARNLQARPSGTSSKEASTTKSLVVSYPLNARQMKTVLSKKNKQSSPLNRHTARHSTAKPVSKVISLSRKSRKLDGEEGCDKLREGSTTKNSQSHKRNVRLPSLKVSKPSKQTTGSAAGTAEETLPESTSLRDSGVSLDSEQQNCSTSSKNKTPRGKRRKNAAPCKATELTSSQRENSSFPNHIPDEPQIPNLEDYSDSVQRSVCVDTSSTWGSPCGASERPLVVEIVVSDPDDILQLPVVCEESVSNEQIHHESEHRNIPSTQCGRSRVGNEEASCDGLSFKPATFDTDDEVEVEEVEISVQETEVQLVELQKGHPPQAKGKCSDKKRRKKRAIQARMLESTSEDEEGVPSKEGRRKRKRPLREGFHGEKKAKAVQRRRQLQRSLNDSSSEDEPLCGPETVHRNPEQSITRKPCTNDNQLPSDTVGQEEAPREPPGRSKSPLSLVRVGRKKRGPDSERQSRQHERKTAPRSRAEHHQPAVRSSPDEPTQMAVAPQKNPSSLEKTQPTGKTALPASVNRPQTQGTAAAARSKVAPLKQPRKHPPRKSQRPRAKPSKLPNSERLEENQSQMPQHQQQAEDSGYPASMSSSDTSSRVQNSISPVENLNSLLPLEDLNLSFHSFSIEGQNQTLETRVHSHTSNLQDSSFQVLTPDVRMVPEPTQDLAALSQDQTPSFQDTSWNLNVTLLSGMEAPEIPSFVTEEGQIENTGMDPASNLTTFPELDAILDQDMEPGRLFDPGEMIIAKVESLSGGHELVEYDDILESDAVSECLRTFRDMANTTPTAQTSQACLTVQTCLDSSISPTADVFAPFGLIETETVCASSHIGLETGQTGLGSNVVATAETDANEQAVGNHEESHSPQSNAIVDTGIHESGADSDKRTPTQAEVFVQPAVTVHRKRRFVRAKKRLQEKGGTEGNMNSAGSQESQKEVANDGNTTASTPKSETLKRMLNLTPLTARRKRRKLVRTKRREAEGGEKEDESETPASVAATEDKEEPLLVSKADKEPSDLHSEEAGENEVNTSSEKNADPSSVGRSRHGRLLKPSWKAVQSHNAQGDSTTSIAITKSSKGRPSRSEDVGVCVSQQGLDGRKEKHGVTLNLKTQLKHHSAPDDDTLESDAPSQQFGYSGCTPAQRIVTIVTETDYGGDGSIVSGLSMSLDDLQNHTLFDRESCDGDHTTNRPDETSSKSKGKEKAQSVLANNVFLSTPLPSSQSLSMSLDDILREIGGTRSDSMTQNPKIPEKPKKRKSLRLARQSSSNVFTSEVSTNDGFCFPHETQGGLSSFQSVDRVNENTATCSFVDDNPLSLTCVTLPPLEIDETEPSISQPFQPEGTSQPFQHENQEQSFLDALDDMSPPELTDSALAPLQMLSPCLDQLDNSPSTFLEPLEPRGSSSEFAKRLSATLKKAVSPSPRKPPNIKTSTLPRNEECEDFIEIHPVEEDMFTVYSADPTTLGKKPLCSRSPPPMPSPPHSHSGDSSTGYDLPPVPFPYKKQQVARWVEQHMSELPPPPPPMDLFPYPERTPGRPNSVGSRSRHSDSCISIPHTDVDRNPFLSLDPYQGNPHHHRGNPHPEGFSPLNRHAYPPPPPPPPPPPGNPRRYNTWGPDPMNPFSSPPPPPRNPFPQDLHFPPPPPSPFYVPPPSHPSNSGSRRLSSAEEGGSGSAQGYCWQYLRGHCPYYSHCKFAHVPRSNVPENVLEVVLLRQPLEKIPRDIISRYVVGSISQSLVKKSRFGVLVDLIRALMEKQFAMAVECYHQLTSCGVKLTARLLSRLLELCGEQTPRSVPIPSTPAYTVAEELLADVRANQGSPSSGNFLALMKTLNNFNMELQLQEAYYSLRQSGVAPTLDILFLLLRAVKHWDYRALCLFHDVKLCNPSAIEEARFVSRLMDSVAYQLLEAHSDNCGVWLEGSPDAAANLSFEAFEKLYRVFCAKDEWKHIVVLLEHCQKFIPNLGNDLCIPLVTILHQPGLCERALTVVDRMADEQLRGFGTEAWNTIMIHLARKGWSQRVSRLYHILSKQKKQLSPEALFAVMKVYISQLNPLAAMVVLKEALQQTPPILPPTELQERLGYALEQTRATQDLHLIITSLIQNGTSPSSSILQSLLNLHKKKKVYFKIAETVRLAHDHRVQLDREFYQRALVELRHWGQDQDAISFVYKALRKGDEGKKKGEMEGTGNPGSGNSGSGNPGNGGNASTSGPSSQSQQETEGNKVFEGVFRKPTAGARVSSSSSSSNNPTSSGTGGVSSSATASSAPSMSLEGVLQQSTSQDQSSLLQLIEVNGEQGQLGAVAAILVSMQCSNYDARTVHAVWKAITSSPHKPANALFSLISHLNQSRAAVVNKGTGTALTFSDRWLISQLGIVLMRECERNQQWQSGFVILHHLHRFGVHYVNLSQPTSGLPSLDPPPTPCGVALTAIKICLMVEQTAGALEVLKGCQWVKASNPEELQQRTEMLVTLTERCLDLRMFQEAWKCLEAIDGSAIQKKFINAVNNLHNKLLQNILSLRQTDFALSIYQTMKSVKLQCLPSVFSSLLQNLCEKGQRNFAKKLCRIAIAENSYSPLCSGDIFKVTLSMGLVSVEIHVLLENHLQRIVRELEGRQLLSLTVHFASGLRHVLEGVFSHDFSPSLRAVFSSSGSNTVTIPAASLQQWLAANCSSVSKLQRPLRLKRPASHASSSGGGAGSSRDHGPEPPVKLPRLHSLHSDEGSQSPVDFMSSKVLDSTEAGQEQMGSTENRTKDQRKQFREAACRLFVDQLKPHFKAGRFRSDQDYTHLLQVLSTRYYKMKRNKGFKQWEVSEPIRQEVADMVAHVMSKCSVYSKESDSELGLSCSSD